MCSSGCLVRFAWVLDGIEAGRISDGAEADTALTNFTSQSPVSLRHYRSGTVLSLCELTSSLVSIHRVK